MNRIEKSNFNRLVGAWRTTGAIKSDQGSLALSGVDSYELILDGNFILHKADVKMGNDEIRTFEIIKLSASIETAEMHYFNSKGEDGVMTGFIVNHEFRIEGTGLRFRGIINEENTEISGKWYTQAKGREWADFMDLRLEKQ